jgi:hypothetical protein
VSRTLHLNPSNWTQAERRSLEHWSLILALMALDNWDAKEKRELIQIIRSQSGRNEMQYWRRTQGHARLRRELLRLGSR